MGVLRHLDVMPYRGGCIGYGKRPRVVGPDSTYLSLLLIPYRVTNLLTIRVVGRAYFFQRGPSLTYRFGRYISFEGTHASVMDTSGGTSKRLSCLTGSILNMDPSWTGQWT